jgi:hypothetical protein
MASSTTSTPSPALCTCQAVALAAEQLQITAEEQEDEELAEAVDEAFLLGACKGQLLLQALQEFKSDLSDAHPALRQQWEEAGMASALTVLDQLQQSGYNLEQGVQVPVGQGLGGAQQGSGDQGSAQQQQQQEGEEEEEEEWQLPDAELDLSFVVQDPQSGEQRRVAVVVSIISCQSTLSGKTQYGSICDWACLATIHWWLQFLVPLHITAGRRCRQAWTLCRQAPFGTTLMIHPDDTLMIDPSNPMALDTAYPSCLLCCTAAAAAAAAV